MQTHVLLALCIPMFVLGRYHRPIAKSTPWTAHFKMEQKLIASTANASPWLISSTLKDIVPLDKPELLLPKPLLQYRPGNYEMIGDQQQFHARIQKLRRDYQVDLTVEYKSQPKKTIYFLVTVLKLTMNEEDFYFIHRQHIIAHVEASMAMQYSYQGKMHAPSVKTLHLQSFHRHILERCLDGNILGFQKPEQYIFASRTGKTFRGEYGSAELSNARVESACIYYDAEFYDLVGVADYPLRQFYNRLIGEMQDQSNLKIFHKQKELIVYTPPNPSAPTKSTASWGFW